MTKSWAGHGPVRPQRSSATAYRQYTTWSIRGNDSVARARYRGTVSLKIICSEFGPLVCQSSEDGRQACMQDFSIGILCSLSCSGSFSLCPSAMSPLLCSLSRQGMHAQSLYFSTNHSKASGSCVFSQPIQRSMRIMYFLMFLF
jgi:hypothetical protein